MTDFLILASVVFGGGLLLGALLSPWDSRPLLDVTPESDPTPAFPVWLVRGRWVPPCPEIRHLNASLREWRGDVRKGVAR